jgi:hypothetical protein
MRHEVWKDSMLAESDQSHSVREDGKPAGMGSEVETRLLILFARDQKYARFHKSRNYAANEVSASPSLVVLTASYSASDRAKRGLSVLGRVTQLLTMELEPV